MEYKTLVFYFFAVILLFSALRVITARNPVHAALYLVLSFVSASGIWMLLQAEFLAIVLVLVYVGAVMVLFLFVVMMLDIDLGRLRGAFWQYLPLGLVVGILMVLEMGMILGVKHFGADVMPEPLSPSVNYSNTRELGKVLYTIYAFPAEIASMILLLAMIAAVSLTLRKRQDVKLLDPAMQVQVQAKDRVRVLQMPAERDEPVAADAESALPNNAEKR